MGATLHQLLKTLVERAGSLTICFALAVSVTIWKVSPTSGKDSRPMTSTGMDGSALRTGWPQSHGAVARPA